MKIDWKDRAKQLVDQHWEYHDIILPIFTDTSSEKFWLAKKFWGEWYKQIGIHFYKHAIEDIKDGKIEIETK